MVELEISRLVARMARIGIAGDTLNTALYLKRNWSDDVAFVTATGSDAMSDMLLDLLQAEE